MVYHYYYIIRGTDLCSPERGSRGLPVVANDDGGEMKGIQLRSNRICLPVTLHSPEKEASAE
jgi:hypothetical protein